jgi:hypothetical protein
MEIRVLSKLGGKGQKSGAFEGTPAPSADVVLSAGVEETRSCGEVWRQELRDDPSRLAAVELAIHDHYRSQADRLTAALLADLAGSTELATHADRAREAATVPLRSPEKKSAR